MKQFPGAIRVSGADRYETAVNFANYAMANLNSTDPRNPLSNEISFGTVGLATGTNYPDALAAANYLTTEGGLLLLTNTTLPTKVGSLIKAQSSKINILHVFGSNLAVSDSVYNQVKNLLNSSAVKGASYDGRTFGEKTWDFLKNLVGIQS
jgi:hypothetical protein